MRFLLALCLLLMTSSPVFSQMNPFDISADVGKPSVAGSSHFDPESQVFTLEGGGYNIWFERDEFHYLHKKLAGDFLLTAHFSLEGEGQDPHRKTGWMVRESLDPGAAHVSAVVHDDGLTAMQWRELRGAFMRDPEDEIFAPKRAYEILQLERQGNTFLMRAAHPGEPLQLIGTHEMPFSPDTVLVGVFVCAHHPKASEKARIWNLRIDRPVASGYQPSEQGYLGCRMEWVEVETGLRRVIYEKSDRFEAPNWMPDGKRLLFNMDGQLWTLPVEGGEPSLLHTGFANRNNNDHGISFDGSTIAISHHRPGLPDYGSTLYTVPIEGGTPVQITELTPSYWHGWRPDGKTLLFVGKRPTSGSSYHIFEVDINTKQETQLTFFDGNHVDGPEYSPDGQWIYYNGNQSGTMQIWRMSPDGKVHEQLTFDEYNDWFPHISPDGQWLVFISFPPDIDVDDHPSYQRVMLRLMPTRGGAPRVIAHLFGGQGSINVPSWSPDSKRIAFVSNSE